MKYDTSTHKRAYELWESGYNLSQISKVDGMPDRRTLRGWMVPSFECKCGYHGWVTLRNNRLKAGRLLEEEPTPEEKPEVEGERRKGQISQTVLNRLSRMFGKNVERELTGDLDADLVSAAYHILQLVIDSMPDIIVSDPYQASQLLRVAYSMLSSVRPSVEVSGEKTDIKITMPEFKRDKVYSGEDEDEDG